GDPNGLWWDDASQTLFIADDDNNRLLKYTDADGITKVADFPAASPSGAGLGQIARLADGSFVITRFGYGTAGDVVIAKTDGTASLIPNLDVTKRRIGIAVASDGTIFDSYFTKGGAGNLGAVAKLTVGGTETDVVTGLGKPVGLTVVGSSLYISDQDVGQLFATPVASPGTATVFAQLPNADIVCPGPNGTIFSGGSDGNVRQISADGQTTVFAGGFQAARGVAYDATNKRLFVADHGSNSAIQIRPVD
ncbi:MAG TPA: hypothetical protein VF407_15485, partial [Polyangiaceae bacterium]